MMLLSIDPDVIRDIVALVHELTTEEVQIEDGPKGDWDQMDHEIVVSEVPVYNPIQQQARALIDNMNEDEFLDLIALMWVGRGTFSIDEFDEARKIAKEEATQSASEYILGTPLVADYLEEGLNAIEDALTIQGDE